CARASELVRALERADDPEALAVLGGRFEEGRSCLGQDAAQAAGLYARAAEQGEAVAMVRLGRLYAEGRGVPKDIAKARQWFRAGVLAVVALEPEVRARALRMALADGAVPRLLDQQLTWLGLVEGGGPASQFDLALRMRAGDGVPKNEEAAEHLMGKLAAEEYPPAWYELGRWRLARASDENETWEAFRHILMAASLGHLPAMLDLARRMLEGRDLEQNEYWTYVAFLEAAELGANVESELALLEERLDYVEIQAALEEAAESDHFPVFKLKSRSTSSRAGSVRPQVRQFRSSSRSAPRRSQPIGSPLLRALEQPRRVPSGNR
ncbi:MAG: tetratricopeptide repeat protein, partial [Geminicoccales bacterium]